MQVAQLEPTVSLFPDSANVYVVRSGRDAILIDIGSGDVLDCLADLGVDRVTDVLLTHFHRDVAAGASRARDAGARVWVPPTERDLIAAADDHWQMRSLDNIYDLREDRFTILESAAIDGVVEPYRTRRFGGVDVLTLPTPGHTPGSVSYLIEVDGRRLAFTGDLIAAPGKVPSLAATQWTYTGIEGLGSTILSGLDLVDQAPDRLLPAHGGPIDDPNAAITLLNERLQALIDLRSPEWQLARLRATPYLEISAHLLRNRTSVSNSYALLSESGAALLIDFGYDFTTGLPAGEDRSSRVPWLETIPALKRLHGIDRVEAAIPTHYHDDHVAGFNLLREIEGTQVWAPENMVPMLQDPHRFDLPCLWYDPIPVDRQLAFGRSFSWHEYEITVHPLPGHTLYAAAIEFEVDGRRVVATGDQQDGRWVAGETVEQLNYQYRNGFRFDDFAESAALYHRLQPDLLISGHWLPRPVTPEYLDHLAWAGAEVARLHRELLPLDDVDFGAGGFGARIEPYRSDVAPGASLDVEVTVRNPFHRPDEATVSFVVPAGWAVEPAAREVPLEASGEATVRFRVRAGDVPVRRARIAADLTVGGQRFGQQAEALVTVR
ncbi:MAG TPA: MBL fold metallo-hydrolase [Candidatus Limnocylindrales bacterium]|nr:MBL fold metallo-hydrolase [Candidatus Limnocylindrales bacterium]